MGIIGRIVRRTRYLLFRDAIDREMDEEMRFHIEKETERFVAEGLSPREARRRALVVFGGVERHRAATWEARGTAWVSGIWADLQSARRSAWRSPRFTLAVSVTLGLAIGVNTAIFSIFEAVLLRPMPSPDADRLATVSMFWAGVWRTPASIADFRFEEWRESQEAFEAPFCGIMRRVTENAP